MKNFIKEYTPFLLAAIAGCLITVMVYRIKEDIKEIIDPKEGDIVVLGDGGSMRLATEEEIQILSTDTVQGKDINTNLSFLIDTNSMYIIQLNGYYTLRGGVRNINTSDLYKD